MAEWLRRWTRNPMGSPRAGSNPAYCAFLFFFFLVQISPDVAPSRPVVRLLLPPADTARPPCSVEGLSHTGAAEVTRLAFTLSIPLNVCVGN